jgi:hypothetical protein
MEKELAYLDASLAASTSTGQYGSTISISNISTKVSTTNPP